jgi:hypothetical protein
MSDEKVVGLHGNTTKQTVPNAAVVTVLKDLLARAEAGGIQQIAFVIVDGVTGLPIDGYAPGGHPDELHPIIAGLELCKATLLSQMM